MTPEREAGLRGFENRLGHHFSNLGLLDQALTHASLANEDLSGETRDNEPLEFLGDAVLGFIVADLLHRRDPGGDEGTKSRARAHLVSAPSLARRAAELGLADLLLLGRGEEKTGGRKKSALWADAYEALIAALFLDGGIETAHRFVRDEFARDLEADFSSRDPKSVLQERLQARGQPLPDYVVVAEEGPSHRRLFRIECRLEGRVLAEGQGHSKKEAQQEAARRALRGLEV